MENSGIAARVARRADVASVVLGVAGWACYALGLVVSWIVRLWLRSALLSGDEATWTLYGLLNLIPTVLGCIGLVLHAITIVAGIVALRNAACSRNLAALGIAMAVLPCCAGIGGAILLVVIFIGLGGGTNSAPQSSWGPQNLLHPLKKSAPSGQVYGETHLPSFRDRLLPPPLA